MEKIKQTIFKKLDLKEQDEYLKNFFAKNIPLSENTKSILDKERDEELEYCLENGKNTSTRYLQFAEEYEGKMMLRTFGIKIKIDFRKKPKDRMKVFVKEIARALEGYKIQALYSTIITNDSYGMFVKKLITMFEPEFSSSKERHSLHWYGNIYNKVSCWYLIDDLANFKQIKRMYEQKDLVRFSPVFKYFKCSEYFNPLLIIAVLKKYPEIEILRRLGFYTLENDMLCLKKMQKEKRFITFLVALRKKVDLNERDITKLNYRILLNFYKDFGFDFSFFKMYLKVACATNNLSLEIGEPKLKEVFGTKRELIRLFQYLEKLEKNDLLYNDAIHFYLDYLKMANRLWKDIREEYWRYPKDCIERHDLLLEQIRATQEAEIEMQNVECNKKIKEFIKKLGGNHRKTIDGIDIYIPENVAEIREQAEDLHQCLITAKYHHKFSQGANILVFLRNDVERIATCELSPKTYEKMQFYCNEIDRLNCLPSESLKNTFEKWLSIFKNEMFKLKQAKEEIQMMEM